MTARSARVQLLESESIFSHCACFLADRWFNKTVADAFAPECDFQGSPVRDAR